MQPTNASIVQRRENKNLNKGKAKANGKPDYSPLPVLSKTDVMKITSTEVGSENLQITEQDLVEIDSFSKQLYDMVMTPFSEDTLVDLKSKNVDKLLNKVKDTLHVDNVPATIKAMRVLSLQDRVEDALFLWKVLQTNPKQCTLFAWTAYLTVLSSHGQAELARDSIKEMVLSGVKPDSYVYGVVVNGLVREHKLEEAYEVSRGMLRSGLRPNNVVMSSLLCGCIATRQLRRADDTFNVLRNHIEEPDAITLSLMIKVSELQRNTERAIALFDSLPLHQQTPTQGTFHAVMHACALSPRYDILAFHYFDQMVAAGFAPTLQSFHILLDACARHGDFARADETLRELQAQGLHPNQRTFSLLERVLANAAEHGVSYPEHPAGNRRFERKEWLQWIQGVPAGKEKSRLEVVRELRRKPVDDGLPETPEPLMDETPAEPRIQGDLEGAMTRAGRREQESVAAMMAAAASPAGIMKGRGEGVSLEELEASLHPRDETPSVATQLRAAVETAVRTRYSQNAAMAQNAPEMASSTQSARDTALASLAQLEESTRSAALAQYAAQGGDVSQVDFASPRWRSSVAAAASQPALRSALEGALRQKFGMAALMGAELLAQKEKADAALREELAFLDSCAGEASTALRVARGVKEESLKAYEQLGGAEPSAVYRRTTTLVTMTLPNRVRDLEEYSERLRRGDPTVPPLKPWLLQEGEEMWRRVLATSGNRPQRQQLNDHLQLYASACCLRRAREVFDSFASYHVTPDAFSYHSLIRMYAKTKRLSEAAQLMKEMQTKGLTPVPESYGEVLIGLARVNDVDHALAVMTDIKRRGLPMPKERYLRPLRMRLKKLGLSDHPSMPEDKEATWKKQFKEAVRKDGKRSNSVVQHAASLV